ncbi:alpha/beta hydrolase [Streptomyces zingiberis]|uniref:Alpha/beta hydrolase n=1 Tax=Streptomyces zingiberis TaxID=2053010 RepID=A0ABX1BZS7_9ACTN|nr:alpha/beta hydrolase [Streptomyces zingiberis]NJQ03126.1 alpha/beta hydrolase [Streptomyces zingiberis]
MTRYTDHHGPAGPRTRGTIVVVPGRGESRVTYTRLGKRLAADAYRVRVTDAPDLDPGDLAGSLRRFGAALTHAVEGTAAEDGVVHPVVLLGADTSAAAIAALLGGPEPPATHLADAVVLAGLPGTRPAPATGGDWDQELAVRTACPAHRATLTGDAGVRRGALDGAAPSALLAAAHGSAVSVPALLLVGDADPLADREALGGVAGAWGRARLSVVRGARHDVLNDLQHRSVAAEIVTFLETLRDGLVPVVAVESTSW